MTKQAISTKDAPQAIGTYSQAVQACGTIYLSGQIGLDPATMQVVEGIDAQIHRVFGNLRAVAAASGASLDDGESGPSKSSGAFSGTQRRPATFVSEPPSHSEWRRARAE